MESSLTAAGITVITDMTDMTDTTDTTVAMTMAGTIAGAMTDMIAIPNTQVTGEETATGDTPAEPTDQCLLSTIHTQLARPITAADVPVADKTA